MNVSLLRLARRDSRGVRRWAVPGFGNPAVLLPAEVEVRDGWGASFRWPVRDERWGEVTRAVDLNRHRPLARAAVRELLRGVRHA